MYFQVCFHKHKHKHIYLGIKCIQMLTSGKVISDKSYALNAGLKG